MRENTSSNNVDVKNSNVDNNTEASKTVSFASIVLGTYFEINDFTVQDATPVPVTSGTPLPNENPVIEINETKNSDISKELLQIARN